jgi:L,D-transpeptidase ErfK/SrfK
VRFALALAFAFLASCREPGPPAPPQPPATDRALEPMGWTEKLFEKKTIPSFEVSLGKDGRPTETVIGQTRTYRVRKKDTLWDIARYYDLGYNEIVDANPGVDTWIPAAGSTIVLPTAWVLPCCTYQGIVLNIPEMRLFYYRRVAGQKDRVRIETYPVGLGRDERRTPRGTFRVRGKTKNPTWNIPPSIRREHIKERGDPRYMIPGGADDNPLGKYRIELTIPLYSIHGTDIAWGVGKQVSHGCVRLYPEDIERLFPEVPIGTPVEFAYQPAKLGVRGGATWAQVHADIYKYGPQDPEKALAALHRERSPGPVDDKLLLAALRDVRGTPVRVSPQTQRASVH